MDDELTATANIPPFLEGIFTLSGEDSEGMPRLVGGYCRRCEERYFPRPAYCRVCLEETEEADLGSEGTLHAFTVVRTRPPLGLPEPYAVGYVDLAGSGLRVFCLLDPGAIDELHIGAPVRLAVAPMGHEGSGEARLRPFFTPLRTTPADITREANGAIR
jgi:uncharacterized OB-fold protein